jgi:eukaryotic-like serine/threonine-protein kinase
MREIRQINRGGFGVVHEVETPLGVRLARKSFSPQILDPAEREKLLRRFTREVRIQSQISHPNIMPIVEFDMGASTPWFTMPLAQQSYAEKILSDRAAGTFDSKPWHDILGAVEELHRLGFVHRDLKPENILLVEGRWMLADFGLILPTARETTVLTSSRSAYGSHFYAAPEQATDFRNTPEQADIFALGCILHDAVEQQPVRVPFAQIRTVGQYGPLLERCTETEPSRRIQNVAALRAALFDQWRTTEFAPPSADQAGLLGAVQAAPTSIDAWRALIGHLEGGDLRSRDAVLRALATELIVALSGVDEGLFTRAVQMICEWAAGQSFDWEYCDVVGDRLIEAYRIASVRVRAGIVLAALELAVSHNRWHVMKQVGSMLAPAAENGLVDRILIEIGLDRGIEERLRRIEEIVSWSRDRWHPKLATLLSERDGA